MLRILSSSCLPEERLERKPPSSKETFSAVRALHQIRAHQADLECIIASCGSWISSQTYILRLLLGCIAIVFSRAEPSPVLYIYGCPQKNLKTGQMPSVISELGPLAPGKKSGIQLSWLHFQLCHGSVLIISLLNGSLETLQACFCFFPGCSLRCWEPAILMQQLFLLKWLILLVGLKALLAKSQLEISAVGKMR